jgi:hypothetical protein
MVRTQYCGQLALAPGPLLFSLPRVVREDTLLLTVYRCPTSSSLLSTCNRDGEDTCNIVYSMQVLFSPLIKVREDTLLLTVDRCT